MNKPWVIISGIGLSLLILNYWWAQRTGYPFLVCWLAAPLGHLVTSWLTFIAVIAVGYLVMAFFVRSHFTRAVVLSLLLFFVLPDLASALLLGGGSCREGFAKHIPAESKRHRLAARVHDMFVRFK